MRREQRQPKTKHEIPIPDDLAAFLREVHRLIETGDDSATIASDDLLQSETAYGGLVSPGGHTYRFTYWFRKGDRHKWLFELDIVDIANIVEGTGTALLLWGCQAENCHCRFTDPNGTCFYCDYIDDDRYGSFSLQDAIPRLAAIGIEAMTAQSSRDNVISLLGPPEETGGGLKGPVGFVSPWIRYQRDDCQLCFEFSRNGGRIRSVSFLPPDRQPGC